MAVARSNEEKAIEVLVIGAGPVGLWAAVLLNEFKIPFCIVDQTWRSGQRDYPLILHSQMLKQLSEIGMLNDVLECGKRIDTIHVCHEMKAVAEIKISKLMTEYPFLVTLSQAVLEDLFEKRLVRFGHHVVWNRRLIDLEQKADGGARAYIEKLGWESGGYPVASANRVVEEVEKVDARYVIGADGYNSAVRRILDLSFDEMGPAENFLTATVKLKKDLNSEGVIAWFDSNRSILWPLSGDPYSGRFQSNGIGDRSPSDSLIVELLQQCISPFQNSIVEIGQTEVSTYERRLARYYGIHPVWLCGDAAHISSPLGVQSLNAGLQEAQELVSRISRMRTGGDPNLLEKYGQDNLDLWRQVFGSEGEISGSHANPSWINAHRKDWILDLPATGAELEQLLEQLGLFGFNRNRTQPPTLKTA